MELTGDFFDHMDKSSNVKKMKGFFQQKKLIFWRLWFKTEKHEQQSYLLQTVSHNVEFKGSRNIWSSSLKSKKNKLKQKVFLNFSES